MIPAVPLCIDLLFVFVVVLTIGIAYAAVRSRVFLIAAVVWVLAQSALGYCGFYQDTTQLPPRILLFGVLPCVLLLVGCVLTPRGRSWMDTMVLRTLTWLHTIRIPVEIVLWLLVERKLLSESMSVGGTNFDILSGLSAPVIAILAFRSGRIDRRLLLVWNIVCTLLLFNVVITAALAIPSPLQQHSFDQPNAALLYFPYNLLPAVVVPLVLFAHVVAFRRLLRAK